MQTISDLKYNYGFPSDWEGLGFESAEAATPRWYGVSIGDGNDGVSHMWPDMYCRTTQPYTLAAAFLISQFKAEYQPQAAEEMSVDGESKYVVQAVLYDPLDRDPTEYNHYCGDCAHEWSDTDESSVCPQCGSDDTTSDMLETESWCNVNGAYMLVDVFPVDGAVTLERNADGTLSETPNVPDGNGRPEHDGLDTAGFTAQELTLAAEA